MILLLTGEELIYSFPGICQNDENPAIWPDGDPHLCQVCFDTMVDRQGVMESRNIAMQKMRIAEKAEMRKLKSYD